MCVLAGYIGAGAAAPILLEMLEREEGLGGGYYTGVATLHEGRLYYEKVVGDVAALRRTTGAERLPGAIGIAHSRTPSGGGREWAHPFVDCAGRLAYVANGAPGLFAHSTDLTRAANTLLDQGHAFRSACKETVEGYPRTRDGRSVHLSDVMCHAIEDAYRSEGDLLAGAALAYEAYPGEIVGLVLHADAPDQLVALRHNQPLVIGRGYGETYAATTSLAFPDEVQWQMAMPAQAAAAISSESILVRPFERQAFAVAPMPSPAAVDETILAALRGGQPQSIGALCEATNALWPGNCLAQKAMLVYQTVAALFEEGLVRLETDQVPGMAGAGQVPRTRVSWRE